MNITMIDPVRQAERSEAVLPSTPVLRRKFDRLVEQYHLLDILSRMRPGRGKSWLVQLINDRENHILVEQGKTLKGRNWLTLMSSLRGK